MSRFFRFPWRSADRNRRELDEELAFHLAERARELEVSGLPAPEAASRARREFGDLDGTRRYCLDEDRRAERGVRWSTLLAEAVHDAGYGVRQLARAPGFAAVAVVTLALGIGANTAIFSAVHGILLAPLPYPDQDRLVTLWQHDAQSAETVPLSPANFIDWRTETRALTRVAIAQPYGYDFTGPQGRSRLSALRVTEGFFDALGAPPRHGRWFRPGEYDSGAARVVVLAHYFWQLHFGGDTVAIGRTIVLDGSPHEIVGIMDPRVDYPWPAQLYTPTRMDAGAIGTRPRSATYLRGIARVAPDVSIEQARGEAADIWRRLAERYPGTNRHMTARIVTMHEQLTGPVRPALLVLLGAVGLVLLIACSNVANLSLARGFARQREMAVRLALGAGRGRLVRQLLVEAAVLAAAGLGIGVLLAVAALGALRRLAPPDLPRLEEVTLSLPVLAFAVAITGVTALACGLAPAWQHRRTGAGAALRPQGAGGLRLRLARAFVVTQVGLAVVLLIGAGLLVRSIARVLREDLGFAPEHRVAFTIHVWDIQPDPAARAVLIEELVGRLSALPGVRAVGAANALPLSQKGSDMDPSFAIEGRLAPAPGDEPTAILTIATPGYHPALGIALRRGRLFTRLDGPTAPPVALISETMARRFWPGEDPIGKRIRAGTSASRTMREIVGVVADVRHAGPEIAPRPEIYVPHAQNGFGSVTFVVDVPVGAGGQHQALQGAVEDVHHGIFIDEVERLDGRLAETLAPRRLTLWLMGTFAVLAAALAAIGIYGLMSFAVAQRTAELGIRMALGADRGMVTVMVLREGLALAGAGVVTGVAGALALTRLMQRLLYGVDPTDPATFTVLAAASLGTAALACWVPARRAARVSPVDAMRA